MPRKYSTDIALRRRRYRMLYLGTAIFLAVATFVVIVLLILMRTPLFRVRKVSITGLTYIPESRVRDLLAARITGDSWLKNFLGSRNMLVWPSSISPSDLRLLPEAEKITIDKDRFTGSINVEVKERGHEGVWCFEAANPPVCYWFDELGLVSRTPKTEGSLILVVDDYARSVPEMGKPIIEPRFLPNLFSIFDALGQMHVNVKEIRLEDLALQEIKVPTFDPSDPGSGASGPTLYFSLRFPAHAVPEGFRALSQKTNIKNLQSIDFRVENRVYYK